MAYRSGDHGLQASPITGVDLGSIWQVSRGYEICELYTAALLGHNVPACCLLSS